MQTMATFSNTIELGEFVSQIRALTDSSRKRVEEFGGPSERTQQDIESGKAMSVTDRACDQYGNFLQHRQLTHNYEALTSDFLSAAFAVFRGKQQQQQLAWEDAPLYPGAGFMVGDLAQPGAAITLGQLATPEAERHSLAYGFAARAGGPQAFTQCASQIANRHSAITLMPWPVAVAHQFTNAQPWPSHQTYRIGLPANDGFPRLLIDPLKDVSDLEAAYLRAAALGASGADRTHLAWAILLANATAAQASQTPLHAWISLFSPGAVGPTRTYREWVKLLQKILDETKLTTTVSIDAVIEAARPYLLPWAEEWISSSGLRFNTFSGANGTELSWGLASERSRTEWDPESEPSSPRLWFCDPELAGTVPAILSERRTSTLVLTDLTLTATGSNAPQYIWCPIGASPRHVLIQQVDTGQWRPALLY